MRREGTQKDLPIVADVTGAGVVFAGLEYDVSRWFLCHMGEVTQDLREAWPLCGHKLPTALEEEVPEVGGNDKNNFVVEAVKKLKETVVFEHFWVHREDLAYKMVAFGILCVLFNFKGKLPDHQ